MKSLKSRLKAIRERIRRTKFRKTVEASVFIAVLLLALFSRQILSVVTGSSVPLAVVDGYSMCPTLREGDLVISYKAPPEDIHTGDIIIYKSYSGELIIHRVIKVVKINGEYYYITKGDNNKAPDPYKIPYDRVEGKVLEVSDGVVLKIPYLGYLSLWIHRR